MPASPVYDLSDMAKDPQLASREMIVKTEPGIPQLGSPMKFSSRINTRSRPAPQLGEHADEILRRLGYSRSLIEKLRTSKVIG